MLVELIPKIARMAAGEEGEHKYYPRPSSAGPERCTRQMVYYRRGEERAEGGDRQFLVFDSSSWHEELVANWIRQTGYTLHSEQMKVDLGITIPGYSFPLGGSIDGIIQDLMGMERLWENKAINHFSFERYWEADPGDLEALPLDNICQACIYCASLQRVQPEITEILLVIKNKNTDNLIEYRIEYYGKEDVACIWECNHSTGETKEMGILIYFPVSYCVDKFVRVETHFLDETLPLREYEYDHWRCDYCPYKDTCWEGFMDEFKELVTDFIMADEFADAVRYFQEIKAQITDMTKERDNLRDWLKHAMYEAKAKEGRAGEYVLKLSGVQSMNIDKKLIPGDMIKQFQVPNYYDKLTVSKPQPKKEKKKEKKDG